MPTAHMGDGSLKIVLALMGVPGAGKTTLARQLLSIRAMQYLSRDDIRAACFAPCSFTEREKEFAFQVLLQSVPENLKLHHEVLVDGVTFSRSDNWTALRDVVSRCGAHLQGCFVQVPIELAKRRVAQDALTSATKDRTPALVDKVAARFAPLPPDAWTISGSSTPQENANVVSMLLDQRSSGETKTHHL